MDTVNKSANAKPRRMSLDEEHRLDAKKPVNQSSEYEKLTAEQKAAVQEWIEEHFVESKIPDKKSSYTLKHRFADSPGGFPMTNGQFKGAMLAAGYRPVDRDELNWMFFAEYKPPKGEK